MSGSPATYATTPGVWSRYPEHLPPHLRPREPVEEWWTWDAPSGPTAVHLDRVPSPDAPCTVVLLHGAGGYGRMFTQVVGLVPDGAAETVAPDLPGYGLTRPARPISYDDWRACAAALVYAEHARSGRPVVLVGGSMGGLLAYDTAAAVGPDVVSGVVATTLVDPRDPAVRTAVARWPGLGRIAGPLLAAARPADRLRVPIAWLVDMAAMSNDPRVNGSCGPIRWVGATGSRCASCAPGCTRRPSWSPRTSRCALCCSPTRRQTDGRRPS